MDLQGTPEIPEKSQTTTRKTTTMSPQCRWYMIWLAISGNFKSWWQCLDYKLANCIDTTELFTTKISNSSRQQELQLTFSMCFPSFVSLKPLVLKELLQLIYSTKGALQSLVVHC